MDAAARGLNIRGVTAADGEAVLGLWRVVFPEYGDPARPQRDPRANIARKIAAADDLFWLAELDGRLAGSAMAGYDGHRGWLYAVGVHPAARRSGVARALVVHAERQLAARGCPKINLQILGDNADARMFWSALGYVEDPVVSYGKRLAPLD